MIKDSIKNPDLPFSDDEKEKMFGFRWKIFNNRKLGKLYKAIPFDELARLLPKKKNPQGAPAWMSFQGMIGLMMLKSMLKLSDEELINRLNTDWELQMFCGIKLSDNRMIKDINLPSRIRIFLGQYLDIEVFQKTFLKKWKPYMQDTNLNLNDATAYESYIIQMSQVDNINLIDYLSYNAFNEGQYLKLTIQKHRERFGICSHVGIDKIYGTNSNRSYMSSQNISHCLPRKGRAPKDEKEQKKCGRLLEEQGRLEWKVHLATKKIITTS